MRVCRAIAVVAERRELGAGRDGAVGLVPRKTAVFALEVDLHRERREQRAAERLRLARDGLLDRGHLQGRERAVALVSGLGDILCFVRTAEAVQLDGRAAPASALRTVSTSSGEPFVAR